MRSLIERLEDLIEAEGFSASSAILNGIKAIRLALEDKGLDASIEFNSRSGKVEISADDKWKALGVLASLGLDGSTRGSTIEVDASSVEGLDSGVDYRQMAQQSRVVNTPAPAEMSVRATAPKERALSKRDGVEVPGKMNFTVLEKKLQKALPDMVTASKTSRNLKIEGYGLPDVVKACKSVGIYREGSVVRGSLKGHLIDIDAKAGFTGFMYKEGSQVVVMWDGVLVDGNR